LSGLWFIDNNFIEVEVTGTRLSNKMQPIFIVAALVFLACIASAQATNKTDCEVVHGGFNDIPAQG
jgi:hypothetical protein